VRLREDREEDSGGKNLKIHLKFHDPTLNITREIT
jgi:hypothetical protein